MTRAAGLAAVDARALAWVEVEDLRRADALAITAGIALERLMENAGRSLAVAARALLDGDAAGRCVAILVGPGNNGGGGLVAARHLLAAGAHVTVHLAAAPPAGSVAGTQLELVRKLGVPVHTPGPPIQGDLVIDALLGWAASGPPRGGVAHLVETALASSAPVLAYDVPTGVALADGTVSAGALPAVATLTVGAAKRVLRLPEVRPLVGELLLGDIGIPPPLLRGAGIAWTPPFGPGPVLRVIDPRHGRRHRTLGELESVSRRRVAERLRAHPCHADQRLVLARVEPAGHEPDALGHLALVCSTRSAPRP